MIAVVDFGAGNTRSVLRALEAVGADARLVADPAGLDAAERVVLPGVGAAGSAMRALERQGMTDALRAWAAAGRPFLGVCLGAQLLLESSDEDDAPGLGMLAGRCRAFPAPDAGGPSLEAYFVHGYWIDPTDDACVAGTTQVDGFRFPSILRAGPLTGVQFHPEKSGPGGRALLAAFARGALDG